MIATILVLYLLLKLYLDMEEEQLYKYMIVLCIVNLIPTLVYTFVSFSSDSLNPDLLLLMTLL